MGQPLTPATSAGSPENLEAHFRALVKQWKKDTEADSSILQMIRHPAYQQIIDMGPPAISLLLGELQREPNFWFAALKTLTGVDPAPAQTAGKVKQMAQAWIEWGRKQGYIK